MVRGKSHHEWLLKQRFKEQSIVFYRLAQEAGMNSLLVQSFQLFVRG